MASLTKTQTALLIRAKASRDGLAHTQCWLITGRSRPKTEGNREVHAARSLVNLGLFAFVKSSDHRITGYGGNTTHVWEQIWSVTEAGRAFVVGSK